MQIKIINQLLTFCDTQDGKIEKITDFFDFSEYSGIVLPFLNFYKG